MKVVKINDVNFNALDNEAIDSILNFSQTSTGTNQRICVINTRVWYHALQNDGYKHVINSADYVVADGIPLHKLVNFIGAYEGVRMRGIDLLTQSVQTKCKDSTHVFVGTNLETLKKMEANFKKQGLSTETHHYLPLSYGSVDKIIDSNVIEKIKSFGADFVWISLGAPKQDYAAVKLQSEIEDATIVGVGLVFDYLAGNVQLPPRWISELGLEWLFRIFTQTKRAKNFIIPFFYMCWFFSKTLIQRTFAR